jgi:pimeloyl-ACP methyl ester carboxylesterase
MLRAHGVHRATFAGHSFGSICVSWMVKHRPQMVRVCALLFLPFAASELGPCFL